MHPSFDGSYDLVYDLDESIIEFSDIPFPTSIYWNLRLFFIYFFELLFIVPIYDILDLNLNRYIIAKAIPIIIIKIIITINRTFEFSFSSSLLMVGFIANLS